MQEQLPGIRDRIVAAWNEGTGPLDVETITRFIRWDLYPAVEEENLLAEAGGREQEEMGRRYLI